MAKTDGLSIDEYIASHPEPAATMLKDVREAIRKALPMAEEVISYNMPAYKLDGEPVLYFAGWKRHYSLYPARASLVAAFKNELAPYTVEKGTIRFPFSKPVPIRLIERIARFRAAEVAEHDQKSGVERHRKVRGG